MKTLLKSFILFTSLLTFNQSVVSQTNFQQEMLNAHNKYRQQVNVSPLTWSNQLANDAQKWANHLASLGSKQLKHDPNTNGQGKNLWLGTSTNKY